MSNRVIVAVTGGIACYKALHVIGALKKRGYQVESMQTPSSKNFVTADLFRALSFKHWDEDWGSPEHISASDDLHLFLVVPATANTIAKLAHGIGDNIVTDTALALPASTRRVISPAMNTRMWENPIVKENIDKLQSLGWVVVWPDSGLMACGTTGPGKLPKTNRIVDEATDMLV